MTFLTSSPLASSYLIKVAEKGKTTLNHQAFQETRIHLSYTMAGDRTLGPRDPCGQILAEAPFS